MVNRRCVKDTYDRGECVRVVTKGNCCRVGYGVRAGGGWDDGVNGQRKTRGEAMDIAVGKMHGAHIVVRGSVKLLIRVLLPLNRCGSRTLRDVFLELKDWNMLGCGVRCGCECMRVQVQRSALEQRSECVGRGAKNRKDRMHRNWERNKRRVRDCPYV